MTTQYRPFTVDDAVAAAKAALSRAAGHPVEIEQIRGIGSDRRRNLILRASVVPPSGGAQPIIIKATRAAGYDPLAADAFETSGLVKEWAATTFLARRTAGPGGSSVLLAGDLLQGVLVFEDAGEALPPLVQPLLRGSAADAEQALTAYAISLGRLHVTTLDCETEHAAIVRAALPTARVPSPGQNWIDRTALKVQAIMGGTLPDRELVLIAERLQAPGPWLALVHRDPCPDNVLLAADGTALLIDFEFSSPGHALLDAAYWRMGFPTCWCAARVPGPIGCRLDRAYRGVLAEAMPIAADDDAFRLESAIITAAWLFGGLASLLEEALREDTTWGISTSCNRILHYLGVAIETTADADILPGVRRAASTWLEQLRGRWPSSLPLDPYPAFAMQVGDAKLDTLD